MINELTNPAREGIRESQLNLGYIFRPQRRYIQYFDEGLNRSFVSALGEKFQFFCTKTLPAKNNLKMKLASNASREGVMNSRMFEGKANLRPGSFFRFVGRPFPREGETKNRA